MPTPSYLWMRRQPLLCSKPCNATLYTQIKSLNSPFILLSHPLHAHPVSTLASYTLGTLMFMTFALAVPLLDALPESLMANSFSSLKSLLEWHLLNNVSTDCNLPTKTHSPLFAAQIFFLAFTLYNLFIYQAIVYCLSLYTRNINSDIEDLCLFWLLTYPKHLEDSVLQQMLNKLLMNE